MHEISENSDFRNISRGCDRSLAEGISPEPLKTDFWVFKPLRILLGTRTLPGKLTSQAQEVHLSVPFLITHFCELFFLMPSPIKVRITFCTFAGPANKVYELGFNPTQYCLWGLTPAVSFILFFFRPKT